jgi:hypothetical protein
MVASMFTPNMRGLADRLQASLEAFSLDYTLQELPAIHRSISLKGTSDSAFSKPVFISRILAEHRRPVLYVDADIVFRSKPALILQLTAEGTEFACYNMLADPTTDCFAPAPVPGAPFGRFYAFSNSVDLIDSSQLIACGAVQYHSPASAPLLEAWRNTIERVPEVPDDESLDYAFNFGIPRNSLRAYWLPKEYCRYAWWIYVRPIIDHPKMPAATNRVTFKQAAGIERFDGSRLIPRSDPAPLPRDYLVDVATRRLLRKDAAGVIAVKPLTIPLWLGS